MNFLAHVFLSGNDEELLLGNFIADSVKGKQAALYSEGVQKGIQLHRLIDAYTDTHPVVHQTKERLRYKYKKYAPVIADMYYDHFLASNFTDYSIEPLPVYTSRIYTLINTHFELLPPRIQRFFPHMMQHNWLLSYGEITGIAQALGGLSRRTSFESGMETAAVELQENYSLYAHDFRVFFPELVAYAEQVRRELRQ
ncbi:ACP phosphodiesterase [Pontibacter vulgaris]|uniref:acyl carrier protein phosphodiesterase n=1 Tax=Pontibacter vulgaris TaxID=2905679 RepID=UPI001FA74C79|nr:ACP phosphodiesterase [Pontibacter vulgaris]